MAGLFSQLLSGSIREQIEQWVKSSNEVSIFICGKTGSGKSTLANAFLGADLAVEGPTPDPTTTEVKCYKAVMSGVLIEVWDSPGLQDGTANEARYLDDIAEKCSRADLFLFCINVGDNVRFNAESREVTALIKLTKRLGTSIWDHAIIALTFANYIGQTDNAFQLAKRRKDSAKMKQLFIEKIDEWIHFLEEILSQVGLTREQLSRLKIVPTGRRQRQRSALPDRPHWLSTFWFEALRSTHPRAQPAVLHMNESRIIENPETVDDLTRQQLTQDRDLIFSEYGSNVGGMMYSSEYLGTYVGLGMSRIGEIELKDRIILEQFLIEKMLKEEKELSQSPDLTTNGSSESVEAKSHPILAPLDDSLSELTLQSSHTGTPTSTVCSPSSPPPLTTTTTTTVESSISGDETIISPNSIQSECGDGGPFFE